MSHDSNGLGKSTQTRIHNITGTQVQALLAKLDILKPHLDLDFPLEELSWSNGQRRKQQQQQQQHHLVKNEGCGKHTSQENSILGHLQRALGDSFFRNEGDEAGTSVLRAIELGAGRGRLSDRLQQLTNCRLDHVLIDRQEFSDNHCKDRVLRARLEKQGNKRSSDNNNKRVIQRVTVDIGSLDLEQFCPKHQKCFCMSKHLCGPASDLSIASIARMASDRRPAVAAIATCCHYLCTWDSFQGRAFWEACGLTKEDFVVAVAASQWASLESRKKSKTPIDHEDNNLPTQKRKRVENIACIGGAESGKVLPNLQNVAKQAETDLQDAGCTISSESFLPSDEFERSYSRNEKVQLGIKLKRLLDLARASALQELGYHVQLVRYTDQSIEDRLLVVQLLNETKTTEKN